MAKGRLLKGRPDFIEGSNSRGELLAPGAPVVEEADKRAYLKLVKTIFLLVLAFAAVAAAVYTALGATLMSAIPEKEGYTWVQRSTFVGGVPARGNFIYASTTTPVDNSALGHLKETFTGLKDAAVLQVVGGPYGAVGVDAATGEITVDGKNTGVKGQISATEPIALNDTYLALCIAGDGTCTPGNLYVIPQDNIAGEAKFDVAGFGKFEPYGSKES